MTRSLVGRLVLSDLYLNRWVVGAALAAGLVSLAMMPLSAPAAYAGGVLLICILVILNIVLVMHGVVRERSDKVLLFIMSLPIDARQYVAAKALANLIAFGIPWLVLSFTTVLVIVWSPIPDGWLPFWVVVLGYLLAYSWALFGVGLLSASAAWQGTAIVVGNISINFLIPYLLSRPAVASHANGQVAVWSADLVAVFVAELLLGAAVLVAACVIRAQRPDVV